MFVPAAAAVRSAEAVPLPSVVTVTAYVCACRATKADCHAERFPALSYARIYRASLVSPSASAPCTVKLPSPAA